MWWTFFPKILDGWNFYQINTVKIKNLNSRSTSKRSMTPYSRGKIYCGPCIFGTWWFWVLKLTVEVNFVLHHFRLCPHLLFSSGKYLPLVFFLTAFIVSCSQVDYCHTYFIFLVEWCMTIGILICHLIWNLVVLLFLPPFLF